MHFSCIISKWICWNHDFVKIYSRLYWFFSKSFIQSHVLTCSFLFSKFYFRIVKLVIHDANNHFFFVSLSFATQIFKFCYAIFEIFFDVFLTILNFFWMMFTMKRLIIFSIFSIIDTCFIQLDYSIAFNQIDFVIISTKFSKHSQ